MVEKPAYQTWIRFHRLLFFWILSIALLVSGFILRIMYLTIILWLMAIPFIYIAFTLTYTYYQFVSWGGNYQSKIHDSIVDSVIWKTERGKMLDIGTGSGSLSIKLAKKFPNAKVTGIDYWSAEWEYSKQQCIHNATLEGVNDRVEFIKASASKLPFENAEFDVLVSCLTFHEVKDEGNKLNLLQEALRVGKKGAIFVFLDLFNDSKIYGEFDELERTLHELRLEKLEIIQLTSVVPLPKLLLQGKILGNAMIIRGEK